MAGLDGSRVQAPETPDAQQLQPQDWSGLNFFAGAAHAPEDNRLEQLADSLGHFSSDVQQFGHAFAVAQRPHQAAQQKADMDAVQQFRDSHTDPELIAAEKAGTVPRFQTPLAQRAMDTSLGQVHASQLAADVQQKVATGELNWSGSAQQYMEQQRQAYLSQPGMDPTGGQAMGYGAAFNGLAKVAAAKASAQQIEDTNARAQQTASDQIEMAIADAKARNLDPSATWAQLNRVRQGLVETLHFEPKELDPIVFDGLMRRSAQDPNWVMGVGNAQRTDLDGKSPLPSLFSKGQYLGQVAHLQQEAHAFNGRQDDAAQQASINGNVAQMLNTDSSRLYAVPEQIPYTNSVTGAQGTVSKSTAVQAAVNSMVVADNRRLASGQASPEQVQNEQLQKLAPAGLKQPQWADELDQGAKGGANFASLSDPQQEGQVLKAYQLYQDLRTKNPAYLNTLVGDDARRLYGTAFMEQSIFGKSPVEAMQAASELSTAPKPEDESKLRTAVEGANVAASFNGWFGTGSVNNPEIASDALKDAAMSLMRLHGMTADKAVAQATPFVQDAFVKVNGTLVPDLHYLSKEQMQPAAERYLQDWATGPAKALNLDPKSLSLAPMGAGRYLITDAASGLPISHGHGMSYVTAKDLIDTNKKMTAEGVSLYQAVQDGAARGAVQSISQGRETRRGVSTIVPAGRDFTAGTDPDAEQRLDAEQDARDADKAKRDASWNAAMAAQNKRVEDADAAREQQEALEERAAHDRRAAASKAELPRGGAFPDMGSTFQRWDRQQ